MHFRNMFCFSLVCLCFLLQRHVEVAQAACSCQREECNSEQESWGQCFLEENKVKYFCCTSDEIGNTNCDCREKDDCNEKGRFQKGMCSTSVVFGRRCCKR